VRLQLEIMFREMADYYPLIARAIFGLDPSAPGESRRALYERARGALTAQLQSVQTLISESEITRERLSLEDAVRQVESEAAARSRKLYKDLPSPADDDDEAQILGEDELPHRPVIDLQPALGEFGDKPAQGEVLCLGALQQPITVLSRNPLRLVPAHLARRNAARLSEAPDPNVRLLGPEPFYQGIFGEGRRVSGTVAAGPERLTGCATENT
jgi:hypothetical protein